MLEGEKEALRKLDREKLLEICENIDKRRSEYWLEACELREAVRKFFTSRGSECVSAMTKLLNMTMVDLKECANGDLIADLTAENEQLREQVRLLRSALKGVSFWQSAQGYYCYDMAHCLQSEACDKHHDCEIANKALQATET
jgi:hypothetical protein